MQYDLAVVGEGGERELRSGEVNPSKHIGASRRRISTSANNASGSAAKAKRHMRAQSKVRDVENAIQKTLRAQIAVPPFAVTYPLYSESHGCHISDERPAMQTLDLVNVIEDSPREREKHSMTHCSIQWQ